MDKDQLGKSGTTGAATNASLGNAPAPSSVSGNNPSTSLPSSPVPNNPTTSLPSSPTTPPVATQTMPNMASALQTPIASSSVPPEATVSTPPASNSTTNFFDRRFSNSRPRETGDIVLSHDQPKPRTSTLNKKPFIIGGIILGVFVIIMVIVALITSGAKSIDNGSSEEKFKQYASYLLYGSADQELSDEYDPDEIYEVDVQFDIEEFDAEYWDNSKGLLDLAVDNFEAHEEDIEGTDFLEALKSYQALFNFVYEYKKSNPPTYDNILAKYTESGAEETKHYIEEYYNSLTEYAKNTTTQEFLDVALKETQDEIDMMALSERYPCLKDDLSEDCIANLSPEDQEIYLRAITVDESGVYYTDYQIMSDILSELKTGCWSISARFQDPLFSEDVIESNGLTIDDFREDEGDGSDTDEDEDYTEANFDEPYDEDEDYNYNEE